MNFIMYDIPLLVLFVLFVSVFLYLKRKNLKREGLLFLYRTTLGIKLINYVGNKYQKVLKFLSYISIGIGYCLMAGVIWLIGKIVWIYVFNQDIVRAIKVPPIMPLIPYLPQVFKLDFLPPFYFTYWIVILAVIAITHEFAHGIFAALNKVKIKTTGFGFFPFFLPIFLAAFVELDEKKMRKKRIFSQLSVLSAGTFANILTAIFFFVILFVFFSLAFSPSGVIFDTYSYSVVGVAGISTIGGVHLNNFSYENILSVVDETEISEVKTSDGNYLVTRKLLEDSGNKALSREGYLVMYDDAPAIKSNLIGAITEINGVKINNKDKLSEELLKNSPGDQILIKTINIDNDKEVLTYEIVLEESPTNESIPWLGIGFVKQERAGIMGKVYSLATSFKKPNIYYESVFDASLFIYNLLWWLILISVSVALINMLPVGIFDGGRFFFLTIFAITKDKNKAEKLFKFATYFFLFVLLLLMVCWVLSFR